MVEKDVLQRLDVRTVDDLIRAGKPLPDAQPVATEEPPTPEVPVPVEVPEDDVEATEEEAPMPPLPSSIIDKPLRGKALQEQVAELVVARDAQSEEGLREYGETLRQRLQQEQPDQDEISIDAGFGGRVLQPELPAPPLRKFVGFVCKSDRWGGELHTERADLKDAVLTAQESDITPFDPDDSSQGTAGECLFSLLRSFDAHVHPDDLFSEALDRIIAARNRLLSDLDLLLAAPLVLFGGYPEARNALLDYLRAYSDLLRRFIKYEGHLHSHSAEAARFVATEMLRLDVAVIRTPTETKAMLTPLHPFHLWRFHEIVKALHLDQQELSDEDTKQLSQALLDLPHLLHFVIVKADAGGEGTVLPQAGNLELLPTYENRTNRYLGADGLNFLSDLLTRWLVYAPYSKPQIRLALVDVPDLPAALKVVAEFVMSQSRAQPPVSVVVDAYYTPIRNRQAGEMARLDYEDSDYNIGELLRSERLAVHVQRLKSAQEVIQAIGKQPVHIAYLFDQSQYQIGYAPRANQLVVSPLVVTYEYRYDKSFRRGTIAPSSEADEGVFKDFHELVTRAASLPPGQLPRLQYQGGPEADLAPVNGLLKTGATRWLALADRVLTAYAPQDAVPLGEMRVGQREVAVWAGSSSKAVDRYVDVLRSHNLSPDTDTVGRLMRRFGHIAAGGLFSLPKVKATANERDTQEKAVLGALLAAAWYTRTYPNSLVASLDSNLARQWLQARPQGNKRADLIGLRMDGGTLVVEPLEVKARADDSEAKAAIDPSTGKRRLVGGAVEQLQTMLDTLKPIFGGADAQPLFTPARREVLKYQIFRECFRDVHDQPWQEEWFNLLQDLFALPQPSVPIRIEGTVVHIRLEEPGDEERVQDADDPLTLVTLGTKAIQRLVTPPDAPGGHPTPPAPPTPGAPPTNPAPEGSSGDAPTTQALTPLSVPETEGGDPAASAEDAPAEENLDTSLTGSTSTSTSSSGGEDQAPIESTPPAITSPPTSATSVAPSPPARRDDPEELARLFRRACQSYRIALEECDPKRAVAGPNIWRFYVRLAREQRLDPLRSALEDIGRQMKRSGLLVTVIPHSDEVALDVPRLSRDSVLLSRVLEGIKPVSSLEQLPVPIGVTPEGTDIIRNMGQMPHLLVGGTTGAGKTVFLYGLLASLIVSHPDPNSLRLLLSTSKPEDFVYFKGMPHLETGDVIADAGEARRLLQTHVAQVFDTRAAQLIAARCQDIASYNARNETPLAPLIVVVDEFADLADQLGSSRGARDAFYTQIRRIAQLGRNKGIHLVLCTQRPSTDLVPSSIRTLMNARVALHVNDATASRMILEEPGAEQLQRHGDLLFKEESTLTRAQGYFISTHDLDTLLQSLGRR